MGYNFNPYTGESEHYYLSDLVGYDGSVSWDYLLDLEQDEKNDLEAYYRAVGLYGQADRLIDPHWKTEPKPTDRTGRTSYRTSRETVQAPPRRSGTVEQDS